MNTRWVLYVAVLGVVAFVLWPQQGTTDMGFRTLTASWQAVFLNRDVATAYTLFLQEGAVMQSERAHTLAHVVGAILYDRYGLDGLRFCTHDFNYGCYHGFAGRVIEEQGLTGIAPLLAACEERDLMSCRHGIGHGIMAYMGNDRLNDALAYCPTESPGPCTSGIFMEYFLNTMRRPDINGILAFDPHNPASPCAVVAQQRHMAACYYGLPKLWRSWISRTTPGITEQFAIVGSYCEHAPAKDLEVSCFAGTGALAVPFSDYDEQTALRLCDVMPQIGRDPCKKEAMNALRVPSGEPGL